MVIKTAVKPSGPKLPSKKPFGTIYDLTRQGLKSWGVYSKYNLRQYDPQVYVDKYTYKPRKRIAGYVGQTIYKTKFQKFKTGKLNKERSRCWFWNYKYSNRKYTC